MTSPVDTTVKFIHSALTGAPVLSGTAGAMIAILDAVLVNGFGLKTADSLVIASNVATFNISTGHGAEVGTVVLVAGATPSVLNGEQKVTALTTTSLSFATSGLSNQTATGTITMKIAPAALWTKQFSGTNLAVYKMGDPTGTGFCLRVDDTGTTSARVLGYESMFDINNGTNAFPTAAQQSGGLFWSKSKTADATARPWQIAVDGRTMFFARDHYNNAPLKSNELTFFGDITPVKSPDVYACGINGQNISCALADTVVLDQLWNSYYASTAQFWMARGFSGLGGSARFRRSFPSAAGDSTNLISGASVFMQFPNQTDGGLYLVSMIATDDATQVYRGSIPGMWCTAQGVGVDTFATKDTLVGVTFLAGRTLRALNCMNGAKGVVFFDTTGPWR